MNMIFALFTENSNTYDDVVEDLKLQKHNTGKSTKRGTNNTVEEED